VKQELSDFMFRGLMAKHALRDMEATGQLRTLTGSALEKGDIDLLAPVSETIRASSIYMQRCYRLLFALENLVREFVQDVLKEKDGADWFDKRANLQVKKKVAERKEKEEKNRWHTGRDSHPVYYIDFGDLALLIQSHWVEFKDLLPPQAWAVSRLNDAERSRNVIAHTNVLSDDEATRLEMILNDWVKQIG
jgi:hypothetical protein